jgi:hypothetical protein
MTDRPEDKERARVLSELQRWLKSLSTDVRDVVRETIKREFYRRDYATFAEDVLLADEHGNPGRLNELQKRVLGLPGGGQMLAVCARQL